MIPGEEGKCFVPCQEGYEPLKEDQGQDLTTQCKQVCGKLPSKTWVQGDFKPFGESFAISVCGATESAISTANSDAFTKLTDGIKQAVQNFQAIWTAETVTKALVATLMGNVKEAAMPALIPKCPDEEA